MVGRAVNLLLPIALLTIHSVSSITDMFFLTMAVAFFAQGTLTNVLVNALVPELVKNNEVLNIRTYLIWTTVTGILTGLFAFIIMPDEQSSNSVVILSAASVALMASTSLAAAPAIAALNTAHRYGIPGLTWGLRIVPVALYFLFQPDEPALHWLLAGIAISDTARATILIGLVQERFCLINIKKKLPFPVSAQHLILASAITGLTPLLIRWIASTGDTGGVSIFEAADRLYAAIASLATIGVGNVTLVYLSRLTNTPEEERGWQLIFRVTLAWSLLWLALSFLFWLFFPFLTAWIDFQSEEILMAIRHTFLALAIGLPGFIMTSILSRRLLTLGYSRALIPMSLVSLACSGILGGLLFKLMNTAGLGLALSISQYIVFLLMSRKLMKISTHANTHPL